MTMLKTNENGRSMIEMLGVLAIIGVLSVGGIAGYSKAMNKFKTNKVADNVSMLVANIKTMYAQQKTYGNLSTSSANEMGLIPDELVKKGSDGNNTYKNAYNGEVEIHTAGSTVADRAESSAGAGDGTTKDNKAFVIFFGGLSREACITLATNDWGSGYSSGLIAMSASGTSAEADKKRVDDVLIGDDGTQQRDADAEHSITAIPYAIATPGGSNLSVPMKVTDAASACACNSGNTCAIVWKYY